jgi:O-antigen/teichoic acid export membrane protein
MNKNNLPYKASLCSLLALLILIIATTLGESIGMGFYLLVATSFVIVWFPLVFIANKYKKRDNRYKNNRKEQDGI